MFEGWEKVQDLAAQLSGVKAQLLDSQGKVISGREALPEFCRLIQSSKIGETRCRKCYEQNVLRANAEKRKTNVFTCHAGLDNIAFPLSVENRVAGAVVCGRVLNPETRPDNRDFQSLAGELGVDIRDIEMAIGSLSSASASDLAAYAKVLKPFIDVLGATIFRYFSLLEKSEALIVTAKESENHLSVDILTGLFNRKYFDSRLESEVSRAVRYRHPLTLVLIELDSFDSKTDDFGLAVKDLVLKEAADEVVGNARQAEVATRYDNNRFAIIMPECDHEQAFRLAERIRKNIAIKSFGRAGNADIQLTASFGITAMYEDMTSERLIEKAEQMLAQSKSDGGNKIRLSPMQGVIQRDKQTPYVYVPNATKKRRVVITGLGPVTPIGIGKEAFWKSLRNGYRGTAPITLFDPANVKSKVAAEVSGFDPTDFIPARDARRMDRFTQFAVAASRLAVDDAGITNRESSRMGVRLGTNIGGIGFAQDQYDVLLERGSGALSPFLAIAFSIGSSSSQVALNIGAKGSSLTIAGECTSGASAIASAYDEIVINNADIMIAGGAEAPIRPMFFNSLETIRLVSTRNDEPEKASRPFDLHRDGIVVGEGAAMLVLEEMEHAQRRGAHIYGELMSYGMTCDSFHMVQPDPEGTEASRAVEIALRAANLRPNDICYINAHGSSTPMNDVIETKIIKKVFGDHAKNIPVSGTKAMTGHAIGAVSAMEAIGTTLSLSQSYLPPTMNYEEPDPDCDLDYVPNIGRDHVVDFAISNSFGFGGKNTILALGKIDEN
ncbi:MAG: beta-ketoacyl-ACP synthase II [Actinomycetota bacterium]